MGAIADLRQKVIEQLLEMVDFALLVIDPRQPGVVLPAALLEPGDPVGLHIGWRLAIPIPDLAMDERGIHGTLSFDDGSFHCTLPWMAIMQVSVDGEHIVWIIPGADAPEEPTEAKDERKSRPNLRLVD